MMGKPPARRNPPTNPASNLALPASSTAAAGYAALSLISLAIAFLAGWWIATQADLLGVRFDRAYYVLLVVLGLSAALMLFGAMRSTARVQGRHVGVAFDVGGPAALFVLVVAGGFWFTQPPDSFNAKLRLRYAGPEIDRPVYDAALPHAKLRMSWGMATNDHPVSAQGEVIVIDVPGRFRDGDVRIELISDRILLVDHDPQRRIRFPGPDQVVEVRAALKEPPERRAEREEARKALIEVVAFVQQTLMRQDQRLFPEIERFLANPSDDGWRRVLIYAQQTQREIEQGIEIALKYDARWGGLLGTPTRVRDDVANATRDPLRGARPSQLAPQPPLRPEAPRVLGILPPSLAQSWDSRARILNQPPDPRVRQDVEAWRDRLRTAYERVLHTLIPLVERLSPPA